MDWIKKRFKLVSIVFTLFGILLAIGFVGYHVSGKRLESEMVLRTEACRCGLKELQGDPFERGLQYKFGAFAGQCIDSCLYRNSHLISVDEVGQEIWVSNVYHQQRFWKARIPISSLQSVEIFFENFRKSFNHVAFRFVFDQEHPVELRVQNPAMGEESKFEITSSLFVSPEGVPPAGQAYNLKDGMMGNYALIYRLFSVEQYEWFAKDLNRTLKSYRARLDKQEMRDLLMVSLKKSSEGLNGVYQLVFNNCATSTIDLFLDSKKKLISENWDIWDIMDPLRGVPMTQTTVGTLGSLKWWEVVDANAPPQVFPPGRSLLPKTMTR